MASGSTPASGPATWSRTDTTRCWPRSSSTARRGTVAVQRLRDCAGRDTHPGRPDQPALPPLAGRPASVHRRRAPDRYPVDARRCPARSPRRTPRGQAAAAALSEPEAGPWSGGWRLNAAPAIRLAHGDAERAVEPRAGGPVARHGDVAFVDVEGQSLEFRLAPPPAVEEAVRHAARAEGTAVLTAPMPGRVLQVRQRPGDAVAAHQTVVVLEAMKMEHAISAPLAGTRDRPPRPARRPGPARGRPGRGVGVGCAGHDPRRRPGLRGRPARRPPERVPADPDRDQAALHRPAGRCRPARDRGHLLRLAQRPSPSWPMRTT